jgi:hypothetical protein
MDLNVLALLLVKKRNPEVQRQPQNLVDVGFASKLHVFSP